MTDREVLISLMENSEGEFPSNWGSDMPIDKWEGVTTNEEGCVIELFLSHIDSLSSDIGNLTNLTELRIGGCIFLSSLPESIGNLMNLTTLRLVACHSLTSLPSSIGDLTNLKKLVLIGGHSLTSLPESIGGLSNLEELYLAHCNIDYLPHELEKLTKLKKISLIGDSLCNVAIPETLCSRCEVIREEQLG